MGSVYSSVDPAGGPTAAHRRRPIIGRNLRGMVSDARGELAVLAIGVLLWVGSTFAAGEMGRALAGGGMVFTAIGSVLLALAIVRRQRRSRGVAGRKPAR